MEFNNVELVGYLASLLLIISFSMKDMKKLRFINAGGCLCFIAYGLLLKTSWPIVITNGFILSTNLWHLIGMKRNPQG